MKSAVKKVEEILGIPNPDIKWEPFQPSPLSQQCWISFYDGYRLSVSKLFVGYHWEVVRVDKFCAETGETSALKVAMEQARACLIKRLW